MDRDDWRALLDFFLVGAFCGAFFCVFSIVLALIIHVLGIGFAFTSL